jgi:transcriptional regulator GlxA family with amidase domain
VLGAAGLLEGRRATGHWLYLDPLRAYGADPVGGRFVEDGKIVTAAGVSAGIDMALHLVGREAGPEVAQAVQLAIEYDPQPPYDAGSPAKAPAPIVEAVTAVARSGDEPVGRGS